jgi:ABC-type phosphate/phosphonate transport system ATPase subunit
MTSHVQTVAEEGARVTRQFGLPRGWPAEGRIQFHGVSMRYRDDLTPALNDVSFEVKPREKVGIVGRTGSGMFDTHTHTHTHTRTCTYTHIHTNTVGRTGSGLCGYFHTVSTLTKH